MINFKINNISVTVSEGTTVLEAAKTLGIEIPTMCYLKGMSNHPSCMMCIVKDKNTNKIQPSCALIADSEMDIITDDEEIFETRKETLELLLSDHVGDCEAPCRPSCPANMNIPEMNRLIASGNLTKAIEVIKTDIAIPAILGYICPAPCEKACRRTQVDEAVSICALKKHVALEDIEKNNINTQPNSLSSGKNVAIIGTGPAGLACAYHLLEFNHDVVLFDKNEKAGGTLRYDIPEDKLPKSVLDSEIEIIKRLGAKFIQNKHITGEVINSELIEQFDAIVIATGNYVENDLKLLDFEITQHGLLVDKTTFEVNKKGIFACGNIIRSRRMAITSVAQGKSTAISVNQYLKGKTPERPRRMFNSKFGRLFDNEIDEYLKSSVTYKRTELPDDKLKNYSIEEAIIESRRCMDCDCRKPISCKLRIYSDEYGANQKKYIFEKRKSITKNIQHQLIVYEPQKCIKCNLCIDICATQKNNVGFTNIGRGFDVEINMPLDYSITEILNQTALDCAENCPTGAISLKITK